MGRPLDSLDGAEHALLILPCAREISHSYRVWPATPHQGEAGAPRAPRGARGCHGRSGQHRAGATARRFFKDKSLNLYIGYSVGGAYDLYARLLARHLPKHLPHSPAILPRNMEGAGSLRLANWL